MNTANKVTESFRHTTQEGFRDIDFNLSNTNKFASVINDQYCVPVGLKANLMMKISVLLLIRFGISDTQLNRIILF